MKDDKKIVTPIDEKEWMTEEEIQEQEQIEEQMKQVMKPWKEHSTGSKMFGIVFLTWFIGSIIAMIILAELNMGEYTVMVFGQYFLVFGLIAFFGKSVDGKSGKGIGSIFAAVGLACIIIPYLVMHPELLPQQINWETIAIIAFLSLFIVVGLVVSLALIKQKEKVFMVLIFAGFFILFPSFALTVFLAQKPEFIITNTNDKVEETDEEAYYDGEETLYKSYKVGEVVTVKLNNVTEKEFYILQDSIADESTVTLFAKENIGTSAFNNDYTDGNDYEGSLIQSKLNELTSTWTNVKEKRLIKVEEIVATNLIHKERESRCPEGDCEEVYTYVNQDSFFYKENEFYWTMTKVENKETTGDTNRYVYFVDLSGCIETHIVGYKPGGEWNPNGTFFENFGIRPVIIIDKEYIK